MALLNATPGIMETANTAVVEGLTQVGTSIGGVFTTVVPIALGIVGAVIVVTFGVKLFKRLKGG